MDRRVRIGAGTLRYQLGGNRRGPFLVLIRPLGGNVDSWGLFRDRLLDEFRVLSFDHRGTGASSPAPVWSSTRQMARDAASLLEELGVSPAHVFGESLGGMVATWLAIEAPARVNRLILVSTPPYGLVIAARGIRHKGELARCILQPARRTEACLARKIVSPSQRNSPTADQVEAGIREAPSPPWELIKQAWAGAWHAPGRKLTRITAPTLVLAGNRDELVPPSTQARLARSLPNGRFEVIEGSGHAVTVEQPLAAAERITQFIRSASSPRL